MENQGIVTRSKMKDEQLVRKITSVSKTSTSSNDTFVGGLNRKLRRNDKPVTSTPIQSRRVLKNLNPNPTSQANCDNSIISPVKKNDVQSGILSQAKSSVQEVKKVTVRYVNHSPPVVSKVSIQPVKQYIPSSPLVISKNSVQPIKKVTVRCVNHSPPTAVTKLGQPTKQAISSPQPSPPTNSKDKPIKRPIKPTPAESDNGNAKRKVDSTHFKFFLSKMKEERKSARNVKKGRGCVSQEKVGFNFFTVKKYSKTKKL